MTTPLQVWTEKYRPERLGDVVNQSHVIERLKAWVKEGSIPNMLFAGSAGVGKTTTALCLARELFGEHWKENFQETNASVTPDTPVMIRVGGKTKRTNFGKLAERYYGKEDGKYAETTGLEILSVDSGFKVGFMPVSLISRHKVGSVLRIKYKGGFVRTSPDHSLVIFDGEGNLVSKKASELRKGDMLVTFKTEMEGNDVSLDFDKHSPETLIRWKNAEFRNPKLKTVLHRMDLDANLSWMFGMYLAEGCATLKPSGTNGVTIFTLAYPSEIGIAQRIGNLWDDYFDVGATIKPAPSGFNRNNMTSVQVRLWNTQLAKFFHDQFYDCSAVKHAGSKRVPDFIFASKPENRREFLKGYMGDASGEWGGCVRYSSVSEENLVDIAWLGRVTGIDSWTFKKEVRLGWGHGSDLVPAEPFIKMLLDAGPKGNPRYALRHQLYHKRAKRISKDVARHLMGKVPHCAHGDLADRLSRLVSSDLSVVMISDVKAEKYDDFVYDVSVPGAQVFWGGTAPVLLHNSDQRGIDVVRGRIKSFAMTRPIGSDFKIIFLDESDSLTPEAQQALRRTMEKFSDVCRFILSCNYSSRIIEPIQSRCSVFRFRRLSSEDVKEYVKVIAAKEKLHVPEDALDAIYEVSEGDLRKATNILQACSTLQKIDRDGVYEVVAQVRPEDAGVMVDLALKGDFKAARKKLYEMLITQGLSGDDIVKAVHTRIFELPINDRKKLSMLEMLGDYEFRLNQGSSPEIQLEAMLAKFMLIGSSE